MRLTIIRIAIIVLFLFSSLAVKAQIHVKAVGDVMLGSLTPNKIIPADSGNEIVSFIGSYLKNADIVFGNLEGAFIGENIKPSKCSDSSRAKGICYEFGMPSFLAPLLKNLGFTILNLDNNHCMDYGDSGFQNTKRTLESLGISYCPPKGHSFYLIKSKRIAVAAFCFENYSNKIFDLENTKEVISKLKLNHDFVIVSFHGGAEGKRALHTEDKTEMFLGENRGNVIKFAHTAIDAGADAVIGHGPHVLRALELYKNKLIAYSLGNFLTYGNFNISGENGISVILDFQVDEKTGDFVSGKIIPVSQKKPGIPVYDNFKKGINLIRSLTYNDFKSLIEIDDDGNINKKVTK